MGTTLDLLRRKAAEEKNNDVSVVGGGAASVPLQEAVANGMSTLERLRQKAAQEKAKGTTAPEIAATADAAQENGLDGVAKANAAIAQTKKELAAIRAQISEREAGLDLDGAAHLYNTDYAKKKRQLEEQENALKQARAATSTRTELAQLQQRKSELEAGLDLDGAAALQGQIDKLKTQSKMESYAGKTYEDNFTGQFSASMAVGRLAQEEAKAWNEYVGAPTKENRERAQAMSDILARVREDNAATLDGDAILPWLSQSLAGYLPQFWDQTKAQVGGAAAGGALAAMTPWTLPFVGKAAKAGATAATGVQSYQVMRGRAFKELLDLGVDEETARKAAKDEALIASMIEMAETGVDLFAGLGSLIKGGGKVATEAAKPAAKKLLTLLGKYGLNVGTEWLEEAGQQAVSIANRENAAQGVTGKGKLAAGTGDVLMDILLGRNKEAVGEVVSAGNEGAKIAAMMGLPGMAGNVTASRAANADPFITAVVNTLQTKGEQEATPNAAGARTAVPTGTDTTQAQNAVQGQRTAVQETVAAVRRSGDLSSRGADMLARSPAALREVGIDPNGKSAAQLRDEVRAAVLRQAEQENEAGMQGRDPLMTALFGPETENAVSEVETDEIKATSGRGDGKEHHGNILEAVRGALDQIKGMGSVAKLTGTEFQKDPNDTRNLRTKVIDFFNSLGNKVTNPELGEIELNSAGARDSTGHGYGPLKAATFAALPDVLTKGKIIAQSGPYEGHNYDSLILSAPVEVNGVPCYVGALVIKDEKMQRYKLHEVLTTNENGTPLFKSESAGETDGPLRSDAPLGEPEGSLDVSIPQNTPVVNSTPEAQGENGHTNTVGAAQAGLQTPDSPSVERESAQRKNWPLTEARQEAGAYTREEWDEVFKYMTRPEAQSMQEAHNLLYCEQDGNRVFLGDIDPEGLQELMDYLKNAPAWTDAMTDTAMLLEAELVGRRRADAATFYGEDAFLVDDGTYREWVQTIREKRTTAGQALQAGAKWSRKDNSGGMSSRQEALDALEESGLSEQEQKDLFDDICGFDVEIERAQTDTGLIDIILRIAQKRGTTNSITGKQSKRLVERARKSLGSLTTEELRQFAYASSAAMATDPSLADAGTKMKVIQVLNMLSSPRTAMTNLAGNSTFYGLDALTMRGAALVDMAVAQLTGTRSVAMEQFMHSKQGKADMARAIQLSKAEITLDVDMGGQSRYGQTSRRTFKSGGAGVLGTGNTVDRFLERALSAAERNMGYALTTSDERYKGAARSTAHATQKLMDEGKIKTQNKNYATEQAEDLAKYRTFQSEGRLISTAIQGIHDVFNLIGIGDSGRTLGKAKVHSFGLGDLTAPFTRVAGNLVSTAVDYNPARAAYGLGEIIYTVARAKLDGSVDPAKQAKAVSDFARGMAGSLVVAGAWYFAKSGVLKRADDEGDEDVAALNQSEGMTGTQVNLNAMGRLLSGEDATWQNGDTLVDLSRIEPLCFLLDLGAELAKDDEGDGFFSNVGEPIKDVFTSLGHAAGDLPILSSVGDYAEDVFKYGKGPFVSALKMWGKTAISSLTPNILAGAAKGLDDKQRSTTSAEQNTDVPEDALMGVLFDTVKSRFPGARQTLPTVVNTLGEEKDNPGNVAQRLINAMLNPVGVNEYSQSEVSQEMERVREKTGETSFYPSKSIPSELSYTDKNDKQHTATLNYEQKQKYQTARSGAQMSVSAAMLGNPLYRKADAKTQAELLEQVHKYANEHARGQVLGKDSMGKWALNSQTAQKDLGMSQTDYLYYYVKYGSEVMSGTGYDATQRMVKAGLSIDQWVKMKNSVDANDNDSVSKTEVMSYIERNYPRTQWRTLFEAYKGNRTWKNPY